MIWIKEKHDVLPIALTNDPAVPECEATFISSPNRKQVSDPAFKIRAFR